MEHDNRELVHLLRSYIRDVHVAKTLDLLSFHFGCPDAELLHKADDRVFAFFSYDKVAEIKTPCVHLSASFDELCNRSKFGILAHEAGHFLSDHYKQRSEDMEIAADMAAESMLGIRIYYDKDKIQWADWTI